MTLDLFAQITINVLQKDGIAPYLPTLVMMESRDIRVMDGIPEGMDHRIPVQRLVQDPAYAEKEFFFGVRSGPEEVTIGHRLPGQPTRFMTITPACLGTFETHPLEECDWWLIE